MKSFSISAIAGVLSLAALSLVGCKKDVELPRTTGTVDVHMDNGVTMPSPTGPKFGSLVLGSGAYKNANGDDFTVSTFRYYISNVKLLKADNSAYLVPDSYYLIDHTKPTTQDLKFGAVPVGDYTGISFTFGVDSTRTKAGNFTGDLSSNNGLLWTMNGVDEFINLELKGYSPQSPSGGLTFHIAGYKHSTTNTIRTVTLPFTAPMLVRPDHAPEIHMHVDIANMFTGSTTGTAPFQNPVKFSNVNNVMGGAVAAKLADNIATGMFSVSHIHAN
ncbi:MAG: hypothetical protein JWR44_1767 [Hymenobacter sp.]|nr:hypothetical protein [Hymenobacter sp.]